VYCKDNADISILDLWILYGSIGRFFSSTAISRTNLCSLICLDCLRVFCTLCGNLPRTLTFSTRNSPEPRSHPSYVFV